MRVSSESGPEARVVCESSGSESIMEKLEKVVLERMNTSSKGL